MIIIAFSYTCSGGNYRVQPAPPDGHCVYVSVGGYLGAWENVQHDRASRQDRMIAVNEAFSIEVIKMIKDSGELVHLWARWRGTPCMCEQWRKKNCLSASTYLCLSVYWGGVITDVEQVVNGSVVEQRPQERHVCSLYIWTDSQKYLSTATQPTHCILNWPSSKQSTVANPSLLTSVRLFCNAVCNLSYLLVVNGCLETMATRIHWDFSD